MKGDPAITDVLNEVLCAELSAVNQYFVHAKMCADWGYNSLASHTRSEAIDEMKHAEMMIDRILFLEGVPNMQKYLKINIGPTVKEQFEFDVKLEYEAVDRLNRGIAVCRDKGDNATREILEKLLNDEEQHVDWLETQLHLIDSIGTERYLSQKLGEGA